MTKHKYTKEVLEPLVKDSFSVAEVIRKLGFVAQSGAIHRHVSTRIKKFGIDVSHFLGRTSNRGNRHVGGTSKLHWSNMLVLNRNGRKEGSDRLRRAMIESGIEHVCATCGSLPIWNDMSLVLQISHKNGTPLDNRKENLHFECPNCHSQTEDFGGKSSRKKSSKNFFEL